MDWSSVTLHELADAVKEADWWSPPRPLLEFFGKFRPPKSFSSWSSRLKCNLFMYRINYYLFMISCLIILAAAMRSPAASMGALLISFAMACINDSLAMSVNEEALRFTRRIYPPLAAKMRAPPTPAGRSRPSKGTIHICGKERSHVVVGLLSVSVLCWFLSAQIKNMALAVCFVMTAILVHASFRIPNPKARLNTFREEFRAVWRSYSDK